MNNLRIPVVILVVVIVAIAAGLLFARPRAAAYVPQTGAASTTAPAQVAQTQDTPPDLDTVASNISGVWESTDDSNYSVDITPDGKWTDRYKGGGVSGDIAETGTYTFFTSDTPDPDYTDAIAPGIVYIKLVEGKDTYYYSVEEADGTNLGLTYLARGNTLSFVKAQ